MLNRVIRIARGLAGLALLVAASVQAQEPCCRSAGLEVAERVPLEAPENSSYEAYLRTKRDKLGHLIRSETSDD